MNPFGLKSTAMAKTFIIASIIMAPFMIVQISTAVFMPKYLTSVYHFNAEYRAGVIEHENTIIGEAIPALVAMYDKHPNWKWTLEIQGFALERMRELNRTGFEMLRDQVNRGQCELISVAYGYPLVDAYPYNWTVSGIIYNRMLLKSLGFEKFSESIFFQESQTLPGFGVLNNPLFREYGIRFRNLLISTATLSLYGFDVNSPIFRVKINGDPDTEFNFLTYNYIPTYQAGAFHAWTWVAPGETITGKNDWRLQGFTNSGFKPYPPNIEWHEEHLKKMEEQGYKFLTCDEWVKICEDMGAVKEFKGFLPETVWRASDSDSVFTWMGKNYKYGNDDGNQIARIYRTAMYATAVENIINNYRKTLEEYYPETLDMLSQNLTYAWRHIWRAMGTDAVGWKPDMYEANYSRWHCANATLYLNADITTLRNVLNITGPIQSVNFNGTILTPDMSYYFVKETTVTINVSVSELPIKFGITSEGFDYNYSITEVKLLDRTLYKLEITADSINKPDDDAELYIKFDNGGDPYPVTYCPTLLESTPVNISASDYAWRVYLPLSNGFFAVNGIPIVRDNTARYVALRLDKDGVGFYEKGANYEPIHYRFYIGKGESLSDMIDFANKLNVYGVVNIE